MISKALNLKNIKHAKARLSKLANKKTLTKSDIVEVKKIAQFEKKYPDQNNVPRPPHWSGWRILPKEIEFWLDGEGRIHERLNYINNDSKWTKEILYP